MIDHHFSLPIYMSTLEDESYNSLKNDVYQYIEKNEKETDNFNTSDWSCNTISSITANKQFYSEILQKILKDHFTSYLNEIKVLAHVDISSMWVNIAYPGSFQEQHNHIGNNNIFSGVIWIDANEYSGNLMFRSPYDNVLSILPKGVNISSKVIKKPFNKGICLFPAFLEHSVQENKSNYKRISVSFNISQIINKNV